MKFNYLLEIIKWNIVYTSSTHPNTTLMKSSTSRYEVGDDVTLDGGTVAKIVKKIPNEGYGDTLSTLYLVQDLNENQFTYQTEDTTKGSCAGRSCKRQKTDESINSEASYNSIPSATNWSGEQKERFNIRFHTIRSNLKSEFLEFFKEEFPEDDDNAVKLLVEMHWDEPLSEDIDAIYAKLIKQSYEFELRQSEASVESCVTTLFELFNLVSLSTRETVKFGIVDMVLSKIGRGIILMNCAVEIKGPAGYDFSYRVKCRNQLAAYLISIAIENAYKLDQMNGRKFSYQNLLGILHIGLTPIFYKTQITDQYLDAILPLYDKCHHKKETAKSIPELLIQEFVPIEPYTDQELIHRPSRSIIFKCYRAFRNLMNTFAEEKEQTLKI